MIEKAPQYVDDETTIPLMVKIKMEGSLRKIQDEYLYWDKVKYYAKNHTPNELWNSVKLFRKLRSSKPRFGNYQFMYMITNYMQRALHQFDLHIGGH